MHKKKKKKNHGRTRKQEYPITLGTMLLDTKKPQLYKKKSYPPIDPTPYTTKKPLHLWELLP
jgi:hypothetical protein